MASAEKGKQENTVNHKVAVEKQVLSLKEKAAIEKAAIDKHNLRLEQEKQREAHEKQRIELSRKQAEEARLLKEQQFRNFAPGPKQIHISKKVGRMFKNVQERFTALMKVILLIFTA